MPGTTPRPTTAAAQVCRRRRTRAARRAICRSILARASLRCLVLLEATSAPPPTITVAVDVLRAAQCATPQRRAESTAHLSARVGPGPKTRDRAPATLRGVFVTALVADAFGTNCYYVAPAPGEQWVVIDPGIGVLTRLGPLLPEHRVSPAAAVSPHGHRDHTH